MAELFFIEGLDEVCQLMEQTPKDVVPRALMAGLTAWARVMEVAIVSLTPRRRDRIGGDAKKYPPLIEDLDFTVTMDRGGRGGTVDVGFGDQGYVALFQEYGHRMVGHGKSKKRKDLGGDVPARPFMRPAADRVQEAAFDAFITAMYAELQNGGLLDVA